MKELLSLCLLLGSGLSGACASAGERTLEVRSSTLVLTITGMTCAVNCPARVQAALASVEGVEAATVDYDTRTATVHGRADLDPALLVAAVQKQGFGASPRR